MTVETWVAIVTLRLKGQGKMELTESKESWNHGVKPPFGTCGHGWVWLLLETEHQSRKGQERPMGEAEQSVVLNWAEKGRDLARRDGEVQTKKLSCCTAEEGTISASVTEDDSVDRAWGVLTALGGDFGTWIWNDAGGSIFRCKVWHNESLEHKACGGKITGPHLQKRWFIYTKEVVFVRILQNYDKELTHVIIGVQKSHDLLSAGWSSRKTSGVVSVLAWRPEK